MPRADTDAPMDPSAGLQCYVVGGAVRDRLLGRPVNDRDWVVVGATPQQMLDRGFRQVGRDFPVFLHPHTHEEYALARTERKSATGYHGFVVHADPSVTLEQDLARRDLTINAMAEGIDGVLIDPFGGQRDLRHRHAAFARNPLDRGDDLAVRFLGRAIEHRQQPVGLRAGGIALVPWAGQLAACERAPRHDRDAIVRTQRQHLALFLAVEQVDVVLH